MAPLAFRLNPNNAPPQTSHHNDVEMDDMMAEMNSHAVESHALATALRQRRQQGEQRAARLKPKNRRKRYLELHPEYFDDPSLELADPLLYDRLVRRFKTAAEREAEARRKFTADTLFMDLMIQDWKKEALRNPRPNAVFNYQRGPNGEILEEEDDEKVMAKEEAREWWVDEMTQRFLRGDDDQFEYKDVDNSEKYNDPEEERDIEEAYFDSLDDLDFDMDAEERDKILTGETGVQDF